MPLSIRKSVSRSADALATSRAADIFIDWRARLAIGLAVILAIAALAWIGGELHYRNCLAKAELDNPGGFSYVAPRPGVPQSVGYLTPTRGEARSQAAGDCSRVPW